MDPIFERAGAEVADYGDEIIVSTSFQGCTASKSYTPTQFYKVPKTFIIEDLYRDAIYKFIERIKQ